MSQKFWPIAFVVLFIFSWVAILDRHEIAAQGNAGVVGRYQIAVAPSSKNNFHALVYMVDTTTGQVWLCQDGGHTLSEKWRKYELLPSGK